MAGLALVLFLAWFLLIFVARTVIQKRATGTAGSAPGR